MIPLYDDAMSLKSEHERINTRNKVDRLITRFETIGAVTGGDKELLDITMESLKGTIHQFREVIMRYETGRMAICE